MSDVEVRVLLIEDDREYADLFEAMIGQDKNFVFCVDREECLEKGIERLSRTAADVVILDLTLPDSRGLETFLKIHEAAHAVPVIILSGMSDSALALEAMRSGAQDYVVKGEVNGKALSRIIRYAIERHKFRETLRRQAQIIDEIHDAVICADLDMNVTDWNKGAERLFGYTAAEAVGQPILFLHSGDAREAVRKEVLGVLSEKSLHATEARMRKKNGEEFFAHLSLGLLRDSEGVVSGMAGYAIDISDRKRVEKLKDEFVNIVSHELRGPMLIIRESVSQIADGLAGPVTEKQKEYLAMNLSAIDRLTRMIDDLLDISKIEAGKPVLVKKVFDLVGLANEVRALFKAESLKRGIPVRVTSSRDKIEVDADRDRIFQVFANLVRNALKFTEKGEIVIALACRGKEAQCAVSDTGKGIAAEYLCRVFEKFGQFSDPAENSEKGTGLGLAISKAIVEIHGGSLRAESSPGEGTTLRFTIPASGH